MPAGRSVTDIVVLVVAADDGVMPQTKEAVAHAKAAKVPIIVAVNKIDKPGADPARVLQQLSERELVPEAWGGDTIVVEVSALQGTGVEELLEQIVLVAEVEELTARVEGEARGVVLEANLEAGRGPVATVIVQQGTLRVGDPVVAGAAWGKVKALVDDRGDHIKEALPSTPVQVLGFSEPPHAGDEMRAAKDLARARTLGEARAQRFRLSGHKPVAGGRGRQARGPLRADLARRDGHPEHRPEGRRAGFARGRDRVAAAARARRREAELRPAGHRRHYGERRAAREGIQRHDHRLPRPSRPPLARARRDNQDVEIRTYEIIYKLIEDVQAAMLGLLAPEFEEVVTGEAEVREIFRVPRVGAIAGCFVRDGVITRGSKVRFLREVSVIIWRHRSTPSSASRTTSARSRRASSAGSACRTSRTSRMAT